MNKNAETGWLFAIERIGNRLPDPVYLFILGTVLIVVGAEVAVLSDWSVEKMLSATATETIHARSVFASDGIWWWLSHLVKNFIEFPPLALCWLVCWALVWPSVVDCCQR